MLTRFLCVILPPPALAAWILERREELHQAIGSFSGRNLRPHVTLFFADVDEALEETICQGLAQGVEGQEPFVLGYQGFTYFANRRTIYVDPVEKERIASLRHALVAALGEHPVVGPAIRETDHPHLTIAAGLKPAQFDRAWALLSPHVVEETGRVGEVVLLKRLLKHGERYTLVKSFPLS